MMKNLILLLFLSALASSAGAQATNKIQADSVRIYQANGSGELILENSTRTKTGAFLRNRGNGRTEFAHALDSVWLDGALVKFRSGSTVYAFNFLQNIPGIQDSLNKRLDSAWTANDSLFLRSADTTFKFPISVTETDPLSLHLSGKNYLTGHDTLSGGGVHRLLIDSVQSMISRSYFTSDSTQGTVQAGGLQSLLQTSNARFTASIYTMRSSTNDGLAVLTAFKSSMGSLANPQVTATTSDTTLGLQGKRIYFYTDTTVSGTQGIFIHQLPYSDGSGKQAVLYDPSTKELYRGSSGSAAPSLPGTGTRLVTAAPTGELGALENGISGQVLQMSGGALSWVTGTSFSGQLAATATVASTTATISTQPLQVYNGTAAATWTLPALSVGRSYFIKNQSAFTLTIQRAGSDQLYDGTAVNSVTLQPGGSVILVANSAYWQVLSNNAASETPYIVTYSATPTFDYTNGANQEITLSGNVTAVTFSNLPDGGTMYLLIKQDATGGRTLSGLPAGSKVINGGAGALTLTTTGSAWDLIGVKRWGSNYLITYGKNFN